MSSFTQKYFLVAYVQVRPSDLATRYVVNGHFMAKKLSGALNAEIDEIDNEDYYPGFKNEVLIELTPKDPCYKVCVEPHESGPGIYFLPIAAYLAGTITSGIIGNLAYDILKKVYEIANGNFQYWIERIKVPPEKVEKDYELRITVSINTFDSRIEYSFDPERGIPPEFIKDVVEKLQRHVKS